MIEFSFGFCFFLLVSQECDLVQGSSLARRFFYLFFFLENGGR